MKGIAIFFGVSILLFLGIPTLLGSIWATGVSSALLTGDFFTELSKELVPQVQQLADDSLEIARQPDATTDPDARAWINAMAQVQTSPSELLRQTGVTEWLENDLAAALQQVDRSLEGEIELQDVVLNLQPLKQAISSPAMHDYLNQVVSQFPACTEQQRAGWSQLTLTGEQGEPVPPCNPGPEVIARGLSAAAERMPAQVQVFETAQQTPLPFRVVRPAKLAVWLLFLAPLFLVTIGSLLAGRGAKGFLGWSGGTVFAGGLLALASSWVAGAMSLSLMRWRAENWNVGNKSWLFDTEEGRKVAAHLGETMERVAEPLFAPVFTIAAVVTGVGVLLLVLSLTRPAQ